MSEIPKHVDSTDGIQHERKYLFTLCLTRENEAAGSSLTGVTALWSMSKTHLSGRGKICIYRYTINL